LQPGVNSYIQNCNPEVSQRLSQISESMIQKLQPGSNLREG